MTKKLTIELPDDLEQQLAVRADALNQPLEEFEIVDSIKMASFVQIIRISPEIDANAWELCIALRTCVRTGGAQG